MNGSEPGKPQRGGAWQLASLGTELAAAVGGGCLLGYWVDMEFKTGPWGLVTGAAIGIVGGLYNLIRKALLESLGVSQRPTRGKTEQPDTDRREPPGTGGQP